MLGRVVYELVSLRRRTHGSVRDEFTITHVVVSLLSMSFELRREFHVLEQIIVYEIHELCCRPYGPSKSVSSHLTALLLHISSEASRAYGKVQDKLMYHHLITSSVAVHMARKRWVHDQWLPASKLFMSFVTVRIALFLWALSSLASLHHHIVYELNELCRRLYGPMAQKKWVHNQPWACFILVRELRVHMAQIKWVHDQSLVCLIIVHKSRCRAHGSKKNRLQSFINHMLDSSLFVSAIVFYDLCVHMALKKGFHNRAASSCCSYIYISFNSSVAEHMAQDNAFIIKHERASSLLMSFAPCISCTWLCAKRFQLLKQVMSFLHHRQWA